MPTCSIKSCAARRSRKLPHLTLHSVPKNEVWRRQWLNAIGSQNINPRHNKLFVCSLHFEESQINRTLDQIRLRDNAVPKLFNMPSTAEITPNTEQENLNSSIKMLSTTENESVLYETVYIQEMVKPKKNLDPAYDVPSTSGTIQTDISKKEDPLREQIAKEKQAPVEQKVSHGLSKLQKLEKICVEQRKIIKRLREKVRRQGKKIGTLEDLLEQTLLLGTMRGQEKSQDSLKRQITKAKGL